MTIDSATRNALLGISRRDENPNYATARWNFTAAAGTPLSNPGGIGTGVSLTYSFLAAVPAYYPAASEPIAGFQSFGDPWRQAARAVLASIAEVVDVRFTEAAGGVGQVTFGASRQDGSAGYAYFPAFEYFYFANGTIDEVTENPLGGDVWIDWDTEWTATDFAVGGQGYETLLHEIGHALGLKHPFEGNDTLPASLDQTGFTVMSYTGAPHSRLVAVSGSQGSYSWVTYDLGVGSLMPGDIAALQYLYGANTATRAGDTTYAWALNEEFIETLWDGGGIDTIDCANQVFGSVIDLTPGAYSSIALRVTDADQRAGLDLPSWFSQTLPAAVYDGSNNLAIAEGVTIENALGGAGNDRITGNAAANRLEGGAGDDTLAGGAGDDVLTGGAGVDAAVFAGARADYAIAWSAANERFSVTSAGEGADTLYGIETFGFADGEHAAASFQRAPPVDGWSVSGGAVYWKDARALAGVDVSAGGQTGVTDADGAFALAGVADDDGTLTLSAAKAAPARAEAGISLTDVLAALKLYLGKALPESYRSPCNYLAADFDGNGGLALTDVLGLLKYYLGKSTSSAPAWVFVDQADLGVDSLTGADGQPVGKANTLPHPIDQDFALDADIQLVGVLRGDVDGSWTGT